MLLLWLLVGGGVLVVGVGGGCGVVLVLLVLLLLLLFVGVVVVVGHYGFSDICGFASFLVEECAGEEDGFADVARTQDLTKMYVTSWLYLKLLEEEAYEEYIQEVDQEVQILE